MLVRLRNNGKHGHLYVNCYDPQDGQYGGLLLGIEQSAPGMSDQYGGSHDPKASDKDYSASGGDFFCKPPKDNGSAGAYIGLAELPIADYYDSLMNSISSATFSVIQNAFEKSIALLALLPEEEKLNFIKEIVSSAGKQNAEGFNQLFDKYFTKIAQVKDYVAQRENTEMKALLEESESLQQAPGEAVVTPTVSQTKEMNLEQDILKNLAIHFMEDVKKNMGWFSRNSKKEILFTQLINVLNTMQVSETTAVVWLLKNFISVALMNRYAQQGETHSGKACLNLLNTLHYSSLKKLLFSATEEHLHYNNLFFSKESARDNKALLLSSARYQGSLYSAFENKITPTEKSNRVLDDFVYQPEALNKGS